MNKKASTMDVIFAIMVLVAVSMAFMFGHLIIKQFADSGAYSSDANAQAILDGGVTFYQSTADNLIFGIFFGSIIVSAILAFIFGQNIIMKVIGILIDMILLFGGVIAQIWWETYSTDTAFSAIIAYYPKTDFLMNHAVVTALLCMLIITIALFASNKQGGQF